MSDPNFDLVVASIRAAARHPLPAIIAGNDSFILNLGFDSMSIARLALALEDQFHQPILLDDWIAQGADPAALTVDSLCRYIDETRGAYEPATV
jgi:acyl carrier protein